MVAMSVVIVACNGHDRHHETYAYDVPLDPSSPWPKFRRTSTQDARSPVRPRAGGHLWSYQTGKGIFSSPVVDGDGNVYVGSADRTLYALRRDGTLRWKLLTGEIIDSSPLLDDRGRIYFGSGDGHLYARDRATGSEVWTFAADPPASTGAFINWFEGNVAMGADGTLYVPNDNFLTYAIDRDSGSVRWTHRTSDQTWSLPAVRVATGRLFVGNNNLLSLLGPNTFALDAASGERVWSAAVNGSIAASPLVTDDGKVFVGGFDGYLRCYDQESGAELWSFGTRDHIYASPARFADGVIVQPSADGTVYALDPEDGAVVWQFDTLDALRSSPAIDGAGHVYLGSGEGRLFVIDPDGTLDWSMRLIDGARDDLNASPALGADAILIAGESGEVFSVPYGYCKSSEGRADGRCRSGPGEDLPADGARLYYTTQFGRQLLTRPGRVEANQPLCFSLFVRAAGDTVLAHIDSASVQVETVPANGARVAVSGDRKFVTVVPQGRWIGSGGGQLSVTVRGSYLVNPDRQGLRFSGGTVGGSFEEHFAFEVAATSASAPLPLPVPSAPGEPSGVWELSRLAAPLPTILPSYNQIGFDSLHYLIGLVESRAPGRAVAWVVGAALAPGENRSVVDPVTRALFPLEVTYDGGLVTLESNAGFAAEFASVRVPFEYFRVAARVDASGNAVESPTLVVSTRCAGITFYGPFLDLLGFCNPDTNVLEVWGGAELGRHGDGIANAPAGLGEPFWSATADAVTVRLPGSTIPLAEHRVALLLVDATTGRPVGLDYGADTTTIGDAFNNLAQVRVTFGATAAPGSVRAYLMVDTYPAAVATLAIP